MGQVLRIEVRYGIFRCFLSPLFLWKRTYEKKILLIPYKDRTVLLWFWMVYSGGIGFIADATQDRMVPRCMRLGFAEDGKALNVEVRKFDRDC